jgi:hypothetical protein
MSRLDLPRSNKRAWRIVVGSSILSLAGATAHAGDVFTPGAPTPITAVTSANPYTFGRASDFAKMIATAPAAPTIDPYHELETEDLFGFTEGTDFGEEGEHSVEFENTGAFGKRGGHYSAIEQEVEAEGVPTQYFGYEISAHATDHQIKNVDGLGDLSGVNFSGLSTELRYLVIGRGPGSPIGLTLVAEPEWERIDGESGAPTVDFSTTFRIAVDTEIIPNHLFAAANLIYAPEIGKANGQDWERSSQIGATTALAYRVTPKVAVGGEIEYYRAYDGLGLQTFDGHALYVGPTMYVTFNSKVSLALAFSAQVAGRAVGEADNLDLTNFERYHSNLKLEFEF